MWRIPASGSRALFLGVLGVAGLLSAVASSSDASARELEQVDFDRDVRPILSENCFHCHGPDAKKRKARLRLDTHEGATQERRGWAAVVPGDPDESELIQRVEAEHEDDVMPPRESHRSLSVEEKRTLRRWVEAGAPWSRHWSFVRPERPALPTVSDATWPRNGIDHFVLARLEAEGFRPSAPADQRTLLRRASLDLIGLPPSPEERAAFARDVDPGRWPAAIERLLASPRYGERMAWPWLDAARYADSNGYQGDKDRSMWPWRDWVVDAYNRNLPFDTFTLWQLAGDLLPDATDEARLATGFLRNHMINGEGGRIAEENRVEYVFDQLETVGTTWMGLTTNCCRCHDHKYDPLTQRNYYQLFDFFNQTPVTGAGDDPRTAPVLAVPSVEQRARLETLQGELVALERELEQRRAQLAAQREDWERELLASFGPSPWRVLTPQQAVAEQQELTIQADGSILAGGENPANDTYRVALSVPPMTLSALRLEALRHESMTAGGLARSDSGNFVLTGLELRCVAAPDSAPSPGIIEGAVAIEFATAQASFEQEGYPVSEVLDEDAASGWAVWDGEDISRDHEALFRLAEPVVIAAGELLEVVLRHDSVHEHHNLGRFRFSASDEPAPELEGGRARLRELLRVPRAERSPEQAAFLEAQQLALDGRAVELRALLDVTRATLHEVDAGVPRVMVTAEREERRATHVLRTGNYDRLGEEVRAGLPEVLPPLSEEGAADRLALARWLVAPENPLTARVVVNRLWAQVFGTGLVKTLEDFGTQGERPSHPELLDWLACEFVQSGWDVKHLLRTILDSATYRQSSSVTPELLARDPENRLLARGARYRLPSWMIRDQALAVSGLLVNELGGPGVRPYQPDGVWREYTFDTRSYTPGTGDELYRRSLYTFWRRIVAPTLFFDSASRQTCSVAERRTNSPLHALATLNDVTYVEAARVLAQRLLRDRSEQDDGCLTRAFETALSRGPSAEELELLRASLERLRGEYAGDPGAAEELVALGESPGDPALDAVEHAAWTGLCLVLLNLDETLTRE